MYIDLCHAVNFCNTIKETNNYNQRKYKLCWYTFLVVFLRNQVYFDMSPVAYITCKLIKQQRRIWSLTNFNYSSILVLFRQLLYFTKLKYTFINQAVDMVYLHPSLYVVEVEPMLESRFYDDLNYCLQ